jgi:TolB-like protein/Flp pilus assembly protein TadD
MTEGIPTKDQPPASAGPSAKAVFLSYASQDADTARQIAANLRAVGIEVWFDQSELEGGDAWDRKIRQQIQSCALFVPIISANTERRPEGYFRLEWWLAEQRSFRMAKDLPFLFPVVTDISGTAQARVPEAFREVQWTRLDGGQVPADFAARVQALLEGGIVPAGAAPAAVLAQPSPQPEPRPALALDDKSIAVLAFVNLSSDKENEYFSDGIAEELLNLLAKIEQLRVIARTSSFSFKGKDVPIAEIARQLTVAHILEGSVRKAGNKVRITAQLIRAADSTHLWSETYDRSLDDIFAVQDEIAAEVVHQLKIRLLGAAPKVVETDPEAYALYLQALQVDRQNTAASSLQALALLDQVLALDPGYVPAWTFKSRIHAMRASYAMTPAQEGYQAAREAASRALALDPEDGYAHASVGKSAVGADRDLAAAARHFARALALSPTDVRILADAATLLLSLGRLQPALVGLEWTVTRDPANPVARYNLGVTYMCAGRFDAALASFRTALRLSPGMVVAQSAIAVSLLHQGHPEEALAAAQLEPEESYRLFAVTMILHALGRVAESDAALAEAIEKYAGDCAYNIAYVLAYRGEIDRAFEWLDKAVAHDDPGIGEIIVQPEFSSLYDDPRWLPFLRRIGMAPEQLDAIPFEVKLPK